MKVAFETLGCKVNQCETERLIEIFKNKGYEVVSSDSFADVYIINTCTVTGMADRKSRQYIRRAKKINPLSIVAATGCYVQMSRDEVAGIEGVDIVCGNKDKMNLPDYVEKKSAEAVRASGRASLAPVKTRGFIKIQDGCDRFCSFCVVPYARSEMWSMPADDILREGEKLIKNGYKEVVLTGINTALYKTEDGSGIEDIIRELNNMPFDFRIRLSSLEPTVIDAQFVQRLFKYEKLCRHLHLSLQSGSDKVLGLMNRKYSLEDYMEIVRVLKGFDECYGISTDLIAGFPGEEEADFAASLDVISAALFCKVHVFKYSCRKGTAAVNMSGHVGGSEKVRRSKMLISEGESSAENFFTRNMDTTRRVLIEEYDEKNRAWVGYTDNYIKVYIDISGGQYINSFVDVRLKELYKEGMRGELDETCT